MTASSPLYNQQCGSLATKVHLLLRREGASSAQLAQYYPLPVHAAVCPQLRPAN